MLCEQNKNSFIVKKKVKIGNYDECSWKFAEFFERYQVSNKADLYRFALNDFRLYLALYNSDVDPKLRYYGNMAWEVIIRNLKFFADCPTDICDLFILDAPPRTGKTTLLEIFISYILTKPLEKVAIISYSSVLAIQLYDRLKSLLGSDFYKDVMSYAYAQGDKVSSIKIRANANRKNIKILRYSKGKEATTTANNKKSYKANKKEKEIQNSNSNIQIFTSGGDTPQGTGFSWMLFSDYMTPDVFLSEALKTKYFGKIPNFLSRTIKATFRDLETNETSIEQTTKYIVDSQRLAVYDINTYMADAWSKGNKMFINLSFPYKFWMNINYKIYRIHPETSTLIDRIIYTGRAGEYAPFDGFNEKQEMELRGTIGDHKFETEYMGMPTTESGGMFTEKMMKEANNHEYHDQSPEFFRDKLDHIVIAVDPAGIINHNRDYVKQNSRENRNYANRCDEFGIVVVGARNTEDGVEAFILEDASRRFAEHGEMINVIRNLLEKWKADHIVYEKNNEYNGVFKKDFALVVEESQLDCSIKAVSHNTSKAARFSLAQKPYEINRVKHINPNKRLLKLEQQLCSMRPEKEGGARKAVASDDRADAATFGLIELLHRIMRGANDVMKNIYT